jgi:CRP/FNR family cyclic AMP-dependent transcriptional regulator
MTTMCDPIGRTDAQRLGELELFAGAGRDLLATLAERSVVLDVGKGRELVSEGSEAREFVVILDGHAAVSVAGTPIAYLGAGSCFGEMSLIDGRRRTATVTAASPMQVIVFSREDFLALLAQEPSFCIRILTMVVGRLRLANSQLAERAEAGPGSPSPGTGSARSVASG